MRHRFVLVSVSVLTLGTLSGGVVGLRAAAGPSAARSPSAAAAPATPRQFLDRYCIRCHNERRKAMFANLALDSVDVQALGAKAGLWEKVIKKLRVRAMPPVNLPRPPAEEYDAVIAALEEGLDRATAAPANPGRPPVHRLNRLQYTHAIRDLFGVEIDGPSMLPADDTGYGFDTIGDVLTMSPTLLDRYLVAAWTVSRLAVSAAHVRPRVTTYKLPYLSLGQADRMSEALPFGSRGGLSVRHAFPADGEYTLRLFLQGNEIQEGSIPRGLDVVNRIDVRLDRERVKVFTVGGLTKIPGSSNDAPKVYEGVGDAYDPTTGLAVRVPVRAGTHTVGIAFNQDVWEVEGIGISRLPLVSAVYARGRLTLPNVGRIDAELERVEIAGPFAPGAPSLTASGEWLVCRPASPADEAPCARRILETLARRAYRRPVTGADLAPLQAFYRQGSTEGGFDEGLRAAIQMMLMDVNFLFRLEHDPPGVEPGAAYRVSDLELASRLSFFLWSSLPDAELLDLAATGRLRAPGVLEQQVRRMLTNRRVAALVDSFFGQWLTTRNVASHRPDPRVYPHFDDSLRAAFQEETRRFLAEQLDADRPALELLTADYTFVNERLARHYGIPHIYGSRFRRVTLPDDTRGGLLGQGSVLMVTSYVDRTSVVVRGKWILETLLGVPPPPPPPTVPSLDATTITGTLRQRMELHRKNPVCATCHAQIDPLGFALENFSGVGMFRTTDNGAAVNASGTLLDGTPFSGPATFRQALLRYETTILTNLTERLLTYALGRGVEPSDMPAVRQVLRAAAPAQHRWSALVLAIVESTPFQMRRAES